MIYDLQKANIWKRVSAYIFDVILLGIAAVGFAFLLSSLLGYGAHTEKLEAAYTKYEAKYDISFDISQEDYLALTEEEIQIYDDALKAFSEDDEVMYTYTMVINLTLLIVIFGILLAYLALEFAVPLLFKNGQTLGKKVFGVGVMRTDSVRISPLLLFIRTILGKYTIETMIPVLLLIMIYFNFVGIIGLAIIGLILLLQIVFVIATRTNSTIHDLLAGTVTVDLASQMIFDSKEALIEYKKKIHAEQVANTQA